MATSSATRDIPDFIEHPHGESHRFALRFFRPLSIKNSSSFFSTFRGMGGFNEQIFGADEQVARLGPSD
jgi:hypothetical protein